MTAMMVAVHSYSKAPLVVVTSLLVVLTGITNREGQFS